MRTIRIICTLALAPTLAWTGVSSAVAKETTVTREHRTVASSGVLTTCSDGSEVHFASVSQRRYTTWWRDGDAVREHRHLDFVGTLTQDAVSLPYTGVWNRDEDLITGQIRITGGSSGSTFRTGGPWSVPACAPTETSSRVPATASWSTCAPLSRDSESMAARARAFSAVLGVLALLAACTTTGTESGSGASSGSLAPGLPASSASPTTAQTTPAPLPALEKLPSSDVTLAGAPGAVLWAYGAIWVMSHRNTTLYRVEPTDLTVSGMLDTGVLGCGDIVAEAESIWVCGCGATPGLVRVDPRHLRVESSHVELNGLGPGFHAGQLWIAAGSGGVFGLRRGDPERLEEAREVPVVGLGLDGGVVESAGSVWVADQEAVVYRVDPQAEQVTAAVPLPLDPGAPYLITHDGAPWYIDHSRGAVARVDPATNTPTVLTLRPIRPPEYHGVAASTAPGRPGELWVRSGSDEAWLIDTRQDKVIRRVAIADGGGGDLEEVDGDLWVAHFGQDTLQRITLG